MSVSRRCTDLSTPFSTLFHPPPHLSHHRDKSERATSNAQIKRRRGSLVEYIQTGNQTGGDVFSFFFFFYESRRGAQKGYVSESRIYSRGEVSISRKPRCVHPAGNSLFRERRSTALTTRESVRRNLKFSRSFLTEQVLLAEEEGNFRSFIAERLLERVHAAKTDGATFRTNSRKESRRVVTRSRNEVGRKRRFSSCFSIDPAFFLFPALSKLVLHGGVDW